GVFAIIEEKPAKQPFCRAPKVYQRDRLALARARPKLNAFCTLLRSFSSAIPAQISRAHASSSTLGETSGGGPSGGSVGKGPGAKRTAGTRSRPAISSAR